MLLLLLPILVAVGILRLRGLSWGRSIVYTLAWTCVVLLLVGIVFALADWAGLITV